MTQANNPPPRADVTLSTGRVVRHTRMPNGAQEARIVGSETGGMTEPEWQEYCQILKGLSR